MDNCLFCKIVANKISCFKVYEDNNILAFKDIEPIAPVHILVIPKKHIQSINELELIDKGLAGELLLKGQKIAKDQNIDKNGFRLIFNTNDNGGQTIYHIHMHIIGGRQMKWPPG